MDSTVRGNDSDAFRCPLCAAKVELHDLIPSPGYSGPEDPLVAICVSCECAYSMEQWQELKGIQRNAQGWEK